MYKARRFRRLKYNTCDYFFLSRATEIFCMVQNGIRFVKNTLNTFPLKSVYIDKSCPRKKSHARTRSTLSEPGFQHFLTTSGESLTWQTKILLPWKSLLWRLPPSWINFSISGESSGSNIFPQWGTKIRYEHEQWYLWLLFMRDRMSEIFC